MILVGYDPYICHHGIKGQKWGIRRYQNADGSLKPAGVRRYGQENTRTLKAGTEIQNISSGPRSSLNNKANRLYGSYTDYDKAGYVDLMGNFQYGRKGVKNTFVAKKDIKIASEREAVKTMAEMFKKNPKEMSQLMADAYNASHLHIFGKSGRHFEKKLNDLAKNPDSKKSLELGRTFISTVPMSEKSSSLANDFYSRMIAKGFDAVLDANDAYNGAKAQDPLIIFNMDALGKVSSVPLTEKELDAAFEYVGSSAHNKLKKDTSKVAHTAIGKGGIHG